MLLLNAMFILSPNENPFLSNSSGEISIKQPPKSRLCSHLILAISFVDVEHEVKATIGGNGVKQNAPKNFKNL